MAGELKRTPTARARRPELWGVIEKLIWQGDFQGNFEDKECHPQDVLRPDRDDQEHGRLRTA